MPSGVYERTKKEQKRISKLHQMGNLWRNFVECEQKWNFETKRFDVVIKKREATRNK
jgi:hypothetical protein